MSFSAKAYDGDLETFLERASLKEICGALYHVALGIEDYRASGSDFYSELYFALEQVCERGMAIERRRAEDNAKAFFEAIQVTMQPPEGTA